MYSTGLTGATGPASFELPGRTTTVTGRVVTPTDTGASTALRPSMGVGKGPGGEGAAAPARGAPVPCVGPDGMQAAAARGCPACPRPRPARRSRTFHAVALQLQQLQRRQDGHAAARQRHHACGAERAGAWARRAAHAGWHAPQGGACYPPAQVGWAGLAHVYTRPAPARTCDEIVRQVQVRQRAAAPPQRQLPHQAVAAQHNAGESQVDQVARQPACTIRHGAGGSAEAAAAPLARPAKAPPALPALPALSRACYMLQRHSPPSMLKLRSMASILLLKLCRARQLLGICSQRGGWHTHKWPCLAAALPCRFRAPEQQQRRP